MAEETTEMLSYSFLSLDFLTCLCSGSDFESRYYRILNCHHRYCHSHYPRLDISRKRKQSTLRVH